MQFTSKKSHAKFIALITALFMVLVLAACGNNQNEQQQGDDDDHHHDEGLIEWSGVYDLKAGTYSLSLEGTSTDLSIMIAFFDKAKYIEKSDEAAAHHFTIHLFEDEPALEAPGAHLDVADTVAYNLTLAPEGTSYELHVPATGSYLVFAEHYPQEFNMKITGEEGTIEPHSTQEYEQHH